MNILSSKQFENRLAENSFPEMGKHLVVQVLQLLFWALFFFGSAVVNYTFLAIIIKTVYLIIVFIGIKACYSINKRIDGSDFIERFILLFFPISLKFLLFAPISFMIIFGIFYKLLCYLGISSSFIKIFIKSFPHCLLLLLKGYN